VCVCVYLGICFDPGVLRAESVPQLLLNPEMVKACHMLMPYIYDFLENKPYSKGKGDFARKVRNATCIPIVSVNVYISRLI